MIKTKTIKTPLVTAETFGPTWCSSALVPESKLNFIRPFLVMPKLNQAWLWSFGLTKNFSHRWQEHHSLAPKLSHRRGKTVKTYFHRAQCFLAKRCFSSGDVFRCKQRVGMAGLVPESLLSGTRPYIGTNARRAKTSEERFLKFLLQPKII